MMKKHYIILQLSIAILALFALTGCRSEPIPVTPAIIGPFPTVTPEPLLLPTPTPQIIIVIAPTPTEPPAVVIEFPPTPTPTSQFIIILPETGADLTGGTIQPGRAAANLPFGSLGLLLLGVFLFTMGMLFRRR
jgi:hypothetical protein